MDDDVISDDRLGSAITNSAGRFCIFYRSKDFKKTFLSPWINVETPIFPLNNGPDIYFKYAAGGSIFEEEDSSRARKEDRKNVDNCFCVTLCLKEGNGHTDEPVAAFFSIGFHRRYHSILNIDTTTGKTTGKSTANWNDMAFYGNLALLGTLTKQLNENPMEYLFQYTELSNPSDPIPTADSAWQDVIPSQIANTVIGYRYEVTSDPFPFFTTKDYAIHANTEQEPVSFNGNWIIVPQDIGFIPNVNGSLITLKSAAISGGNVNMAGLIPGDSTTTIASLQRNRYFSIRMLKREAGNSGTEVVAGFSRPLAMFNTIYQNVPQGGSWQPGTSNELGVASMDIAELASTSGCAGISDSLNISYTAANPNLGNVSISMSGPGGPHSFGPIAHNTPGQEAFGTASYNGDVSKLPKCAFIVQLNASLQLTDGEDQHDTIRDRVAFCKTQEISNQ